MLMAQGESGHKYTAGVVAEKLNASKAHVSKVVTRLVELGFVDAVKGRGGGIYLVDSAMEKSVGHLLRILEDHEVVDCAGTGCPMVSGCLLRGEVRAGARGIFCNSGSGENHRLGASPKNNPGSARGDKKERLT